MDFKQIQELVKMVNKSNISELSIEQDKFKITIKQKDNETQQVIAVPTMAAPVQAVPQAVAAVQAPVSAPAAEAQKPAADVKADNLVTIKSPMIGTFYRSPGPDKPSFVNVGDEVSPGKVVCIIEAMKLFNEIESEVSGKIVKILVDDASPVEYDQPLYLVEP
ncbi:acetyl-CoA carboxylase biotin carboxyl carrier protein [Chitinophaga silvisoli]|jgi:acetyl-CoA carboxylase biotin carboxyl carrier protein|uniref:Biotin carboxyl carrier protein of acetyl-CoA carboxylase n=1 Tax=Chitinophaga silvisoli TaxID=2291814 RepID=A0A3E1P7G6_9BACT|nr:acetyl-CoA carboxylase biotin carboxyl carrier protein [Chitinophaga silvisoli]RFM36139.1 acetyl-CoA carboxylase biotin carboxyl carrier protein [Chitinophaga silvisoli]